MTKNINLKKNISISLVARVLTMLIGFISSIIITRYLGPELKGKMSYFITLSGTIWMILDLGFHKSLPYVLAKNNSTKHQIFSISIFLYIFDILVLLLVSLFFKDFILEKLNVSSSLFLILFVAFTSINHFGFIIKYIMLGLDKILWQNLLNFLPSVLYLILFLMIRFFIPNNDNRYFWVLLALVVATVFWTFYYAVKLYIAEDINITFKINFKELYQMYHLGIKAFLGGFFIFLLIRFDIFLIKKYETLAELGIYSLAANFVTLLQSFSNVVGSLMLPKFAGKSQNAQDNILTLKRMILIFSSLFIFVVIVFTLFGRPVISAVYGIDFVRSADVFALLLPAVLFLSIGSLINSFFWSKGFPTITIILPIIALSVNIILNILLIPKIGIMGAAIATSISYFIWLISLIIYFFNSKLVENPELIIIKFSDIAYFYEQTLGKIVRKR